MLLMFFIYNVVILLSEQTSFLPLLEGALCFIASTAFCAEYLLFYCHSTIHKGLEGHYHLLLVLLVAFCILSSIAGALMPTSFAADLSNGIALALWFYQSGITSAITLLYMYMNSHWLVSSYEAASPYRTQRLYLAHSLAKREVECGRILELGWPGP
ncbi:hypothetical protein POM88_046223 [Heracleum sosnowskyi]|uniref:Uncharacterized protein n=1 Tax=Heracleum sosnowskyi TaxID=360622 RepID=A0AAD8H781_9APIA|nr:hypothetical protein POM88_046223 [Heracleum sosnowskyi]